MLCSPYLLLDEQFTDGVFRFSESGSAPRSIFSVLLHLSWQGKWLINQAALYDKEAVLPWPYTLKIFVCHLKYGLSCSMTRTID
jgi:hypothetical protein